MVEFIKMHGLGNDFVLINKDLLPGNLPISHFAKTISDRHTGLGCDQFIIYQKQSDSKYLMWIYNQDGSEAGACGNATRCVAKLSYLDSGETEVDIQVASRILPCKILSQELVRVNMGKVSFEEIWMPNLQEIWELVKLYNINPRDIICADIGNPHFIIITDNQLSEEDQNLLGSLFEKNPIFPKGVNVNFANITDGSINLRVWERGTGITLACGSGACATFAAARKLGFVSDKIDIYFALGKLEMSYSNDEIYMNGPATIVAKGVYNEQNS